MKKRHAPCLFAAAFLVLAVVLSSPAAVADELLDVTRGAQDGQDSYGGRGYAVHYEVPDKGKTWWCVAVKIHGEAYGNAGKEFFTISFMDAAGKVYARSRHPKSLFSGAPEWKTVRITPTQLPPDFWVIVDFKAAREQGVYIGYAGTGGGRSMLADSDCRLAPVADAKGKARPIDWCIACRVRSKYKGKMIPYDPEAEPLNKPEKTGEVKKESRVAEGKGVVFSYEKLDDVFGASVVRLVETAREGLELSFGLSFPETIRVLGGIDGRKETAVSAAGKDGIEWNVKTRNELLPVPRGGTYRHVFSFCREVARIGILNTLPGCRLMPGGMADGLSSYLGGSVVAYLGERCGQKLWPIRFSYIREEGPKWVERWVAEKPEEPARRYAGLFKKLEGLAGKEKTGKVLKETFLEGAPAREFVKRLEKRVLALEGGRVPPGFFPPDMVDPPFLWLCPEPDLSGFAAFKGLRAKRFRTEVILSYDDGTAEGIEVLDEGFTLAFRTPPGSWTVSSLKMFGRRVKEGGKTAGEGKVILAFLDRAFAPLGRIEAPLDRFKTGKASWQNLGGAGGIVLSGPFLVRASPAGAARGRVEIGCDTSGGGGHSFIFVPASHAEAPSGPHDWMFRVFLASAGTKDKKELDAVLRKFRKEIPR